MSGMNLDRAYTLDKRSYDKSMRGILAMSSPPTGQVGVVRQLAMDANIISPRGYIKIADKDNELHVTNLFGPAELLTPMTAQTDDSPRVAMTTTQAKHVIPAKKYDKLLVGNGSEKALAHIISDDFAFKAKEDGKVVDLDEQLGVVIIEYKNGSHDVIDTTPKISKNGGGGFYITNKLSCNLKKGNTFKKGDILAANDQFFSHEDDDTIFKAGTLAKVAIMSGYFTYEDSGIVTNKLCDQMTTNVVMKKDVVLGRNSNVEYVVEIGQRVEVGDPLLIFDESYDDEGMNKLLAGMDSKLSKELANLGKVPVKAKYSGIIEDIKIYTTIDTKELSTSMQKLIKKINAPIVQTKQLISKYTDVKGVNISLHPTETIKTDDGKIKGVDVGEGVLIEFYINYEDRMGIGDKFTYFTALKSVICEIIPEGMEPYSESRPDEEISAFLSPISVLARMTGSVVINGCANKVLIELKRKMTEIYNSK